MRNLNSPVATNRAETSREFDLRGATLGGRYRVRDLVATGGMGHIYRAEQMPIGRMVALKVLRPKTRNKATDPAAQLRFFQEAATLARLRHPNTVTLFDYGESTVKGEPLFFMAMELVEGRPLHQVLREEGRLNVDRALRILWQVARSLREAHREGVVHRDLKPSNIMIVATDQGESVKVLDFGIAKLQSSQLEPLTLDNRVVGSPRYMSPEQILQKPVDGRSDIYALGIVLHELLTGRPPFLGQTAADTMVAHVRKRPPTLEEAGLQDVAPEVQALLNRCLAKRPEKRFADVTDLMRALRRTRWVSPDEEITDVFQDSEDSIETELPAVLKGMELGPDDPEDEVELETDLTPAPEPPKVKPAQLVALLVGLAAGAGLLTWTVLTNLSPGPVGTAEAAGLETIEPLSEERMTTAAPHDGAERGRRMIDAEATGEEPSAGPMMAADARLEDASVRWIRLESVPTGATVWEGNARLGHTPMRLAIPAEGSSRRTIELRYEGYRKAAVNVDPGSSGGARVVELEETAFAPR